MACPDAKSPLNKRNTIMNDANQEFIRPGYEAEPVPGFPHAPFDWTREQAEAIAKAEAITLTEEHWQVVRALQEICARNAEPAEAAMNTRDLHDALDEHFHAAGGIKHLYTLFPKGPLGQGCLLAGLQPPAGTQEPGMGSAV
jgi:tRNA 2-thiouridine synthesizing protein E